MHEYAIEVNRVSYYSILGRYGMPHPRKYKSFDSRNESSALEALLLIFWILEPGLRWNLHIVSDILDISFRCALLRPAAMKESHPSSQFTRSPLSMRMEQKGTESEPPPAPEEGDSPRRDWQVPQAVSTSQQRHAFVTTKFI